MGAWLKIILLKVMHGERILTGAAYCNGRVAVADGFSQVHPLSSEYCELVLKDGYLFFLRKGLSVFVVKPIFRVKFLPVVEFFRRSRLLFLLAQLTVHSIFPIGLSNNVWYEFSIQAGC